MPCPFRNECIASIPFNVRYAEVRLLNAPFGPTDAELDEAYAAHRIYRLWEDNRKVYGRRKLWKAAIRGGMIIGRDQVERLMRIIGIRGVSRGRCCCKVGAVGRST